MNDTTVRRQRRRSAKRAWPATNCAGASVRKSGTTSPIPLYPAAAREGTLGSADADKVSESTLNRQMLPTTADIEHCKVMIAARRVRARSPSTEVVPHQEQGLRENRLRPVGGYPQVVESSDDLETVSLMNPHCVHVGTPLVRAAVTRRAGQLGVHLPGHACRA